MCTKVTSFRLPVYIFDYLEDIHNELNKQVDEFNRINAFYMPLKKFTRADVIESLIRSKHAELFGDKN